MFERYNRTVRHANGSTTYIIESIEEAQEIPPHNAMDL